MICLMIGMILSKTTSGRVSKIMDDFVYNVDTIAEDCYDLYVSDDAGYTWEFYGSYERKDWAIEDGEALIWNAGFMEYLYRAKEKSYISHDN